MKRLALILAGVAVAGTAAATPTVAGLAGNPSFSHEIPVPVPSAAKTPLFADDRGGAAGPGEDHGTSPATEPGDDRGGTTLRAEPGDDRGGTGARAVEPGDDHGGAAARASEPGDDHGGVASRAEPGDDSGGHRGGRGSG